MSGEQLLKEIQTKSNFEGELENKVKRPHYHQYERMKWPTGSSFYKCMQPGCAHYLPTEILVIGRESLCWGGCNRLVVITKEMLHEGIKHPMCERCKEERKERREALTEVR